MSFLRTAKVSQVASNESDSHIPFPMPIDHYDDSSENSKQMECASMTLATVPVSFQDSLNALSQVNRDSVTECTSPLIFSHARYRCSYDDITI